MIIGKYRKEEEGWCSRVWRAFERQFGVSWKGLIIELVLGWE